MYNPAIWSIFGEKMVLNAVNNAFLNTNNENGVPRVAPRNNLCLKLKTLRFWMSNGRSKFASTLAFCKLASQAINVTERPPTISHKNSPELHQSREQPLAKVGRRVSPLATPLDTDPKTLVGLGGNTAVVLYGQCYNHDAEKPGRTHSTRTAYSSNNNNI